MRNAKNIGRLLVAALSLGAAAAGAEIIDTTLDYATNPANGQWTLWSMPTTGGAYCSPGTPVWNSVDQTYVIETELPVTCKYTYYRINFPHALDGTSILHAKIKVEATAGAIADSSVYFGYSVDYTGFGTGGRVVNNYRYDVATGGWQTVGGDYTNYVAQSRANVQRDFALSDPADFIPKSSGPVIYFYNNTVGVAGLTPRSVTLRVTIDDVHVQHDGSALDSVYLKAADDAAAAYYSRVYPTIATLHTDIAAEKTLVDGLSLSSHPVFAAKLAAEATAIATTHSNNVAAAAARNEAIKLPTQAQYSQDVAGLQTLNTLADIGNYVANGGEGLVPRPWNAVGSLRLDDTSLAVPIDLSGGNVAFVSLGELEPLSFVLQNLNDQAVSIASVAPGTLANQFGETLPAGKIDVRIVKSWYTGSAVTIGVSPGDTKVRVPELLLKDDDLVHVDETAQSNSLRIVSNGSQTYQDVSSPTARMPNDAVVEDAATLQPFSIAALRSRQLWLTIDARTDVRPGYYSGNVDVAYQISGDATPRVLHVPVEFSVIPQQLQKANLLYGIYYRGKINAALANLGSEYKTEARYLAEMKDMLDHGVDHPTQYIGSSLTEVANYVSLRTGLGFPCDKYFLGEGLAAVGTNETAAAAHAASLLATLHSTCPDAELYMYGADEAQGQDLIDELKALKAVHTGGGKTFVAGYVGTYAAIHEGLDTLVYSGAPNDTEIALWRNSGKDVYSYGNPQTGVPNPLIYRTNYGFLLWRHNYTGAMDYAYQHAFPGTSATHDLAGCATSTTSYCSMWNDFDADNYYDHVFAYPTSNGVVDTIQWEGFREAVDDMRYVATLQSTIAASDDPAAAADAQAVLDAVEDNATLDPATARYSLLVAFWQLNKAPVFSDVQLFTGADAIFVAGEAIDPEGYLGRVEVSIDGGAAQEVSHDGSWSYEFSGLADGMHTVRYTATDYWGAMTEEEQQIEVDTQAPGCGE